MLSPLLHSNLLKVWGFLVFSCAACAATNTPDAATNANGSKGSDGGGTVKDPNNTGGSCGAAGGFGIDCQPKIHVTLSPLNQDIKHGKIIGVNAGELDIGKSKDLILNVTNNGNSPLTISAVDLLYEAKSPDEGALPAFQCFGPDGTTPCATAQFPTINTSDASSGTIVSFTVRFTRYKDDAKRTATMRIHSDDKSGDATAKNIAVLFTSANGLAKVQVSPPEIDLGQVAMGGTHNGSTLVTNVGTSDLQVPEIDFSALDKAMFTAVVDSKEYPTGGVAAVGLAIAPGTSKEVKLVYKGVDDKAHTADIVLHTNDATLSNEGGPGWKRVAVKVNTTGPCLLITPHDVVFGATILGASNERPLLLKACGDQPAEISDLAFVGNAGTFSIKWSSIAELGGVAPTVAKPLIINQNTSKNLMLVYNPEKQAVLGPDGPTLDKATIKVTANTVTPETKVTLSGFGSSANCPSAVITVIEGETVVPQTVLHLNGKQSQATVGKIAGYQWSVQQPKGSVGLFAPNNTKDAVQFTPNVAGDYTFSLMVTDDGGKVSCYAAKKVVKVLPDQAIHGELLWDTPGDKDQTDEGPGVGSDMDLHFAHQFAANQDYDKDGKADPWFADTYDCFWHNPHPEWGSYDPNIDDNPSLDRDDTDGAGPENLNLTLPEDGKTYAFGVHYFNDVKYGASIATVRIYVYGALMYQATSTTMQKDDLWYVATISWPAADIIAVPGKGAAFFITPKYPHPAL